MGPLARLFGSLANALLDVGLPQIRAWLRERLGDGAEVAHVAMEGSFIHLDGVRLPIGPRGVVTLERATAEVAPSRGIGMPEMRLFAFRGVLRFGGDGEPEFRAEIAFTATPEGGDAAWISGDLAIERATWTPRPGAAQSSPMEGSARLLVTSSEWRLSDGRLASTHAKVRFMGTGGLEGGGGADAIRAASLVLEAARVGPFVDAIEGIAGRAIDVPPGVPLDAHVSGDLAWTSTDGGTCGLRIDGESVRLEVAGTAAADGTKLVGRVTGEVMPAAAMERAGLAPICRPRVEDSVAIAIDIEGDVKNPVIRGTARADALGFRFGRARFTAPLFANELRVDVDVMNGEARVRLGAKAGKGTIAAGARIPIRGEGRRVVFRFDEIEAPWLVAVARAAGLASLRLAEDSDAAGIAVPRDARATGSGTWGPLLAGAATIKTPRSEIAIDPLNVDADGAIRARVHGEVAFADAATLGLGALVVRPAGAGSATIDFQVEGHALHGTVAAKSLDLEIASRLDLPASRLEDVVGAIRLSPEAFRYDDVRFVAYGGSFRLEGTVPLAAHSDAARLVAHVKGADASFGRALARLAKRTIAVPASTRIAGEATLAHDASLTANVAVETEGGTALLATLAPGFAFDVRGALAIADALGVEMPESPVLPMRDGIVHVEAWSRDDGVSGFVTSDRIAASGAGLPVFVATDVSVLLRVSAREVAWRRFEARAYEGVVSSDGTYDLASGTIAKATVAARDVAVESVPIDSSGRLLGDFVLGRLMLDLDFAGRAGRGRVRIDRGAFPAVRLLAPRLARYHLRAPDEIAVAPATGGIDITPDAFALRDLHVAVPGLVVDGALRIAKSGALGGKLVATLGEELLAKSVLLAVPRALAETLTLPIALRGTTAKPLVDVNVTACLGRLAVDNRVASLVKPPRPRRVNEGRPPPRTPEPLDGEWLAIEQRLLKHRGTRFRVA